MPTTHENETVSDIIHEKLTKFNPYKFVTKVRAEQSSINPTADIAKNAVSRIGEGLLFTAITVAAWITFPVGIVFFALEALNHTPGISWYPAALFLAPFKATANLLAGVCGLAKAGGVAIVRGLEHACQSSHATPLQQELQQLPKETAQEKPVIIETTQEQALREKHRKAARKDGIKIYDDSRKPPRIKISKSKSQKNEFEQVAPPSEETAAIAAPITTHEEVAPVTQPRDNCWIISCTGGRSKPPEAPKSWLNSLTESISCTGGSRNS